MDNYSLAAALLNQEPTPEDYLLLAGNAPQAQPKIPQMDKDLKKQLEEAIMQSMAEQKRGVEDLSNIYKAQLENQKPQVDLSPLLALTDTWTGSKMQAGYKRPETSDEMAEKAMGMQAAINKARSGLTDDQTKFLQSELNNKLLGSMSRRRNFEDAQLLKKEDTIRKDLDKSVFEPIKLRQEQFSNIDDAFASGDYQSVWAMLSQFSRGVSGEKGVLTDHDITRVMPKNIYGDIAKVKSYFSETPSTQMDQKYVQQLRNLVGIARKNASRVYGQLVNDKEKTYRSSLSYKNVMDSSGKEMFGVANDRVKLFNTGGAGGGEPKRPSFVPEKKWNGLSQEEKEIVSKEYPQ